MQYEIKKNVPIPAKKSVGRGLEYPFDKMQVGDMFEIVGLKRYTVIYHCATSYGKRHKLDFLVQKIGDDKIGVWRTK